MKINILEKRFLWSVFLLRLKVLVKKHAYRINTPTVDSCDEAVLAGVAGVVCDIASEFLEAHIRHIGMCDEKEHYDEITITIRCNRKYDKAKGCYVVEYVNVPPKAPAKNTKKG